MGENEIDLIKYSKIIWKWKYLIILGTLAATIIAILISFSLPKVYRATVTFLVTTSPIIRGPGELAEPRYDLLIETYKGFINNKLSLTSAIKKFNLGNPPQDFSLDQLESKVSVKSVRNSKLLQLNVELPNPQLAADIANFLAETAVNLNAKLSQGDTFEAQKFINEELKKIEQEFQEAEKELLAFQKHARMADLRSRNATLLGLYGSLSQNLNETGIDLTSELGKMNRLSEELKNRSPKISLTKSLIDDPAYQQLISSISSSQQKDFLHLSLKSESINEAYGKMDQDLVISQAEVDKLKSKKNAIMDSLAKIGPELQAAQITLAQQGMEETRLNNRYQLASTVYQDFRRKLEEANINVFSKSQDLKILDPAIIPSHPIKPRKRVVVMFTFFTAGIGFLFLAFLLEYINSIIKTKK